jgi:transformation/transcription domain-associated protein
MIVARTNLGTKIPLYLMQTGSMTKYAIRAQERFSQMLVLIKTLALKHKDTRKRGLFLNMPSFVPLAPKVNLVVNLEHDAVSLAQIYAERCAKQKQPEVPYDMYMQALARDKTNAMSQLYANLVSSASALNYSENILSEYVEQMLLNPSQLFAFKKQFATQMGMLATVGHIFHIGKRKPQNILVHKSTGSVSMLDFYPSVTEALTDLVPLRLTRNIQHLLAPNMLEGALVPAMTSLALCLVHYKDQLKHHIALFYRDELLPHTLLVSELGQRSEQDIRKDLDPRIETHTAAIVERVQDLVGFSMHKREQVLNQKVLDLVEAAKNPVAVAQMEPHWLPWF